MELKEGKMSSKSIAAWLGVSYGTYKNNISKYLEKLSDFCEFEPVYGGVIITQVYIPVYDKTLRIKCDKMFIEEIRRCAAEQSGLASIAGMARKFVANGSFDSFSTAKRQLTQSSRKLFGKIEGFQGEGIAGLREYLWAVKLNDYNKYRLLTPEEEKRFDEIIEMLYTSQAQRVKKAALLEEAYRKDETMSKEEYFEQKERLDLVDTDITKLTNK